MQVDVNLITLNEEEQLPYALKSIELLAKDPAILQKVVIIDNGSTDATLQILDDWQTLMSVIGVRVEIHQELGHRHHGQLRTLAIQQSTAPWILYLDADESWTSDMLEWLQREHHPAIDVWSFYKYSTIVDRYHYTDPGAGPALRLFRNLPGCRFPQNIHTEPTHDQYRRWELGRGPFMFDHTACKSEEALWAKGWRYQWAAREHTPAIGPTHEYVQRVANAFAGSCQIVEFPEDVRRRIFTGPEAQ